ncbi:hypothetical protein [Bacteroides sp.]|uniref:hypothetical protein n=1 Tax=Bacteroides sp. TaxID=29523 RepID=UPI003996390A
MIEAEAVLPLDACRLPQPVTEHVAVTFKYAYAGKPLSEAKEAMNLDVAQTTEWSSTYHYKITLPAAMPISLSK